MLWITLGLLAVLLLALAAGTRLVDRLLAGFAQERAAWSRERGFLLQRIQSPAVAVAQFDPSPEEGPEQPPTEEEARVFHSEQDEILHNQGRA